MIEAYKLKKQFGRVTAVADISFKARPGEIFGFLGPNGAGKTTTLRMLYGLLRPTAGQIRVADLDVSKQVLEVQKRIGVLPDGGGLYQRLTARENIRYFGELQGMTPAAIDERIAEFVQRLNMEQIIDRKTKGFSQGERMKIGLARALVHDPDYLLLDEPTNGLDVITTRAVRQLLLQLRGEGKCVIFSSHLMHEVEQLCDRIAIVANGRVISAGTVPEVCQQAQAQSLEDAFVHFAYERNAANA